MPLPRVVRSAREVNEARRARQEEVLLVLGQAVNKIIRSKRAIVATRVRLVARGRDRRKNPRIA